MSLQCLYHVLMRSTSKGITIIECMGTDWGKICTLKTSKGLIVHVPRVFVKFLKV